MDVKSRVLKWFGIAYGVATVLGVWWYLRNGLEKAGDLADTVSLVVGLLALPATLLAVSSFQRVQPDQFSLSDVADQLAQAVSQHWEAEAQVRQLNNPYPLQVSWRAAECAIVEPWPIIERVAKSWPGGPYSDQSQWAQHPTDLQGDGGDIYHVFMAKIPTRRLVVLGDPGSGKTVLLLRLALSILAQREPGNPVPVIFSLASWDPSGDGFYEWLTEQLVRDHPGLLASTTTGKSNDRLSVGRALLEGRFILPILDGLDELSEKLRPEALAVINRELPHRQALVLSSRIAEYRGAVSSSSGARVHLNGASGIVISPLDLGHAAEYLTRTASGSEVAELGVWAGVFAEIDPQVPLGRILSTPLFLYLARTIYTPRPHESSSGLLTPDDLLDVSRFPDRQSIESHLFSGYIAAAYRHHKHYPSPWDPKKARKALAFLARHLQDDKNGSPDLAWWDLHLAVGKWSRVMSLLATFGIPSMVMASLSGVIILGVKNGITAGLVFGSVVAIFLAISNHALTPSVRWGWSPGATVQRNDKIIIGSSYAGLMVWGVTAYSGSLALGAYAGIIWAWWLWGRWVCILFTRICVALPGLLMFCDEIEMLFGFYRYCRVLRSRWLFLRT
ncbi:NACHT domain-containing protein [Streptomyces sp. NPDC051963]|uniref:NACHT domain-containing protein n=1 Tax=Streptomyces sp. NPDC051963 TaxID=3365678 RepID=UPI0037CF6C61